jgi:hypothetical protein
MKNHKLSMLTGKSNPPHPLTGTLNLPTSMLKSTNLPMCKLSMLIGTPKGKLNMTLIGKLSPPTGKLSKTMNAHNHTLNGKPNGKHMPTINHYQTNKSMNTHHHASIG